jgi:O-antigen/teichoic acid export membrane protein
MHNIQELAYAARVSSSLVETATVFNVPRGTAYITIQQIVFYATSFLYYVLLVRVLNLSQVGEVSLLAAASSIFTTLTQLALPAAATRFISSHIGSNDTTGASSVAATSLKLLLVIAGPGVVIAILASPWIGTTVFKTADSSTLLVVTFAASFLFDLTALYGAFFLGLGLYADILYQNILFFPLSRGLGIALAYKGLGPLGIPLGWAIGALATLLLSLYLWKGKLKRSRSYPPRPLLGFGLPLFASALVILLQSWGDIALLQGILGQFGNTGAYYIIVSSVSFLSILWMPVAAALYPALSSIFTKEGPTAISVRLAVATRLVNLTVLPTGAALAVIAPTALEAVYGASLGNQAIPFAILATTLIFSAQSLLLITTLQSVSRTAHILGISLAATIIDLVTVGLGANSLGTTAGAIGRALLAITTMLLAWFSLRRVLHAPVAQGLSKALVLTLLTALPLLIIDTILTLDLRLGPLLRIPLLLGIFVACFLATSRGFNIFSEDDFDLLKNALPTYFSSHLGTLERLLIRQTTETPRASGNAKQQETIG